MKKSLIILVLAGMLLGSGCGDRNQGPDSIESDTGTISFSGAWALYPMVVRWSEEYGKLHPGVKMDIAAGGAGKGMADALADVVDIGMVSRDVYPAEIEKGAWWVSVTKDAVVPTINAENPFSAALLSRGVTRDVFSAVWITGEIKRWGGVTQAGENDPIRVYTRSDACGAAKTWAKYLGGSQEDLLGVGVYGDPGLAGAVGKDLLGIGFNNINYAYDVNTKQNLPGIRTLPLDLNGNGKLDPEEDFYGDRDAVVKAIAEGVYPSPPARALHFVSQGAPRKRIVREFIQWVLTEGQQYVSEAGYIRLPDAKLESGLEKLK